MSSSEIYKQFDGFLLSNYSVNIPECIQDRENISMLFSCSFQGDCSPLLTPSNNNRANNSWDTRHEFMWWPLNRIPFCWGHQRTILGSHRSESLLLSLKKRLGLLEETSPRASCYPEPSLTRKQSYFCIEYQIK